MLFEGVAPHFSSRLLRGLLTFLLVSFAWLFFRAGDFSLAIVLIKSILTLKNKYIFFDGSLFNLGVSREFLHLSYLAIALQFFVDYHKYRGKDVASVILQQGWWFRTIIFSVMALSIILFGCYGELYNLQQFIYFQF